MHLLTAEIFLMQQERFISFGELAFPNKVFNGPKITLKDLSWQGIFCKVKCTSLLQKNFKCNEKMFLPQCALAILNKILNAPKLAHEYKKRQEMFLEVKCASLFQIF